MKAQSKGTEWQVTEQIEMLTPAAGASDFDDSSSMIERIIQVLNAGIPFSDIFLHEGSPIMLKQPKRLIPFSDEPVTAAHMKDLYKALDADWESKIQQRAFDKAVDCHLISIGLAAESGEEFYAEVPYPDEACSAFVRDAVIPLLGKIPHSECAFDDLYLKIINWMNIVRYKDEEVDICFDSQTDWDLFANAMDYRVPSWCKPRFVGDNLKEFLIFHYHEKNQLPVHHALYDAQANRYAYRETPPETS